MYLELLIINTVTTTTQQQQNLDSSRGYRFLNFFIFYIRDAHIGFCIGQKALVEATQHLA